MTARQVHERLSGLILTKPPVVRWRAFTLIELLVVIAIISLLVSILLPSLNRAKSMARQVVCLAHLKQIGLMNHLYAEEHNDVLTPAKADYKGDPSGRYPGGDVWNWGHLLSPYAGKESGPCQAGYDWPDIINGCPDFKYDPGSGWNSGYGLVWPIYGELSGGDLTQFVSNAFYWQGGSASDRFIRRSELVTPSRRGWQTDSPVWHTGGEDQGIYDPAAGLFPWWSSVIYGKDPIRHGGESCNIVFADGRAANYGYMVSGHAFYDTSRLP